MEHSSVFNGGGMEVTVQAIAGLGAEEGGGSGGGRLMAPSSGADGISGMSECCAEGDGQHGTLVPTVAPLASGRSFWQSGDADPPPPRSHSSEGGSASTSKAKSVTSSERRRSSTDALLGSA